MAGGLECSLLLYYTALGLSFDVISTILKFELELITDIDMVLFFESGLRLGK